MRHYVYIRRNYFTHGGTTLYIYIRGRLWKVDAAAGTYIIYDLCILGRTLYYIYTAYNNALAIVLTLNYRFNMDIYVYGLSKLKSSAAALSSVDGGVMKTTSS